MFEVAKPYPCRECPLQHCPGLRPLEERQLDYIQTIKTGEYRFERGDTVLQEQESCDYLFTILEGVAIRFLTLDDGRRQIVNFMFPGDLIGLQGAFDDVVSHSVEAILPLRLCRFRRNDFVALIKEHPRLGYDITWLAAKEESALEGHLVSLGQRSARERVVFLAVWLLDRALATGIAREGNKFAMPITQSQIADMLGLSLVHTNRTIRALDRDGLVQWTSREICVPDMEKAAEFADFDLSEKTVRPFI
ncbi:Crp/Fnr family transcriptional regulator [Qipengyuania gaetbuli]|nr:Crp/Fnr family transcriptional regulator [Qipengyuania gaetbuli]